MLNEPDNEVKTREELVNILNKIRDDYLIDGGSWENDNLQDYLEAMSAWIADMDGFYKNIGKEVPDQPSWQTIADILLAAKNYE